MGEDGSKWMLKGTEMTVLRAAGYYLIMLTPRLEWLAGLLPERLISASRCLCPKFPGSFAYSVGPGIQKRRKAKFDELRIPRSNRKAVLEWAKANSGESFGRTNTFFELEAARAARERFFEPHQEMAVVGLGLPEKFLDCFRSACRSSNVAKPLEPTGLMQMVEKDLPLKSGGEMLGYELLNVSHGLLNCSWSCFKLEKKLADRLDVQLNPLGKISELADAERCFDYLEALELRDDSGPWMELGPPDPGPWIPWALMRYS